jgi:hypothetical protein
MGTGILVDVRGKRKFRKKEETEEVEGQQEGATKGRSYGSMSRSPVSCLSVFGAPVYARHRAHIQSLRSEVNEASAEHVICRQP